jgi:type VI secretion system secreted protein VgrG
MNAWPETKTDEELVLRWPIDDKPVASRKFEILRADGSMIRGVTDAAGKTGLQKSDFVEQIQMRLLPED